MRRCAPRWTWLLVVLVLSGCDGPPLPQSALERDAGQQAAAARPGPAAPEGSAARSAPADRPQIEIPAGEFRVGSMPGTGGRRATREALPQTLSLGAFSIDRLPYPNDPLRAPLRVATRDEAEALCAERGARLCHELEWERACAGSEGDVFAGGQTWDAERCVGSPYACAASTGALRMGTQEPEWTASDLEESLVRGGHSIIRRGAREDEPASRHRCAARSSVRPSGDGSAAFRCCQGPAPTIEYPSIQMHRPVRALAIDSERARAILASMPETSAYAADFTLYGLEQGDAALTRNGHDRSALSGWELAEGPLAWSPAAGELAWILAGRSGDNTLLVVAYPMLDGTFTHGASFILQGEVVPLAVAHTPAQRSIVQWSACWGCPGESGVIERDDEAVVRVIQR